MLPWRGYAVDNPVIMPSNSSFNSEGLGYGRCGYRRSRATTGSFDQLSLIVGIPRVFGLDSLVGHESIEGISPFGPVLDPTGRQGDKFIKPRLNSDSHSA